MTSVTTLNIIICCSKSSESRSLRSEESNRNSLRSEVSDVDRLWDGTSRTAAESNRER